MARGLWLLAACGALLAGGASAAANHLRAHAAASDAEAKANPCACRTYASAYKKGKVRCGQGQEFFSFGGGLEAAGTWGRTFCTNFFEKIEDGICMNFGVQGPEPENVYHGGQWCYVSPECPNHFLEDKHAFSTSRVVGTKVAWKICNQTKDPMSRQLNPEQLFEFSQAHDIDLGLLVKMSYPVDKFGNWSHIHQFWEGADPEVNDPLTPKELKQLQRVADSGKPMVWSDSEFPPFFITLGMKAWIVELNWLHGNESHPATYTVMKCIHNCDSKTAVVQEFSPKSPKSTFEF